MSDRTATIPLGSRGVDDRHGIVRGVRDVDFATSGVTDKAPRIAPAGAVSLRDIATTGLARATPFSTAFGRLSRHFLLSFSGSRSPFTLRSPSSKLLITRSNCRHQIPTAVEAPRGGRPISPKRCCPGDEIRIAAGLETAQFTGDAERPLPDARRKIARTAEGK